MDDQTFPLDFSAIASWFGNDTEPACPPADQSQDYRFDPTNATVRAYLGKLGFAPAVLDAGRVTPEQIAELELDPFIFSTVAQMVPLPDEDCHALAPEKEISEAEAAYLLLTIANVGDPKLVSAIFTNDVCPNGRSALTVLGNYNGRLFEPHLTGTEGVQPETECSVATLFDLGFPPKKLAGLHFTDEMVPDEWREAGRSVVPILYDKSKVEDGQVTTLPMNGTAVLVPGGWFLIAQHTIETEKRPHDNLRLVTESGEIPFTHAETRTSVQNGDLSILNSQDLNLDRSLVTATLAENKPEEDTLIFHVGFPGLDPKLYGKGELVRTYTVGTYLYPTILDGYFTQFCTGARLYYGYSGGALFDANAELIGINYSMEAETHRRSWATSVFSEDAADREISGIFGDIRAIPQECEDNAAPISEDDTAEVTCEP